MLFARPKVSAVVSRQTEALTQLAQLQQVPPNPWGLVWPRGDGKPQTKGDRAAWYEVAELAGVTVADGRNPLLPSTSDSRIKAGAG